MATHLTRSLLLTSRALLVWGCLAGPLRAQPAPSLLGRGDPALVRAMNELLAQPALRGARSSILVERVDRPGRPLFALHPDRRLHPASNTKIVTVAAALDRLGPTYTFRTDLVAGALDEAGTADAVYLIGQGDPRFVKEDLFSLIEDARVRGLRAVAGDLVVDQGYFTPDTMAPGFNDKDQDSAYRAASGAMSLNFNSTLIRVRPGKKAGAPALVSVSPDSGYLVVESTAITTSRGRARIRAHAAAYQDRTRIVVGGRIPVGHRGIAARKRIDNPGLFAGLAAKLYLERAGVEVKGKVRLGRAPAKQVLLARHRSRPLSMLVADVNKFSNNFMAEQLFRTLGVKLKGARPADSGAPGGWGAGRAAVTRFLRQTVGLPEGFVLRNGSGLFGDTALSARDLVAVLRYMRQRRPALPEFLASLSIGGADGTLKRRLRDLERGTVRAKTGTLDGVVCVSGYLELGDGSTAIFSIMANDLQSKAWRVWRVHDAMLRVIAEHGAQ